MVNEADVTMIKNGVQEQVTQLINEKLTDGNLTLNEVADTFKQNGGTLPKIVETLLPFAGGLSLFSGDPEHARALLDPKTGIFAEITPEEQAASDAFYRRYFALVEAAKGVGVTKVSPEEKIAFSEQAIADLRGQHSDAILDEILEVKTTLEKTLLEQQEQAEKSWEEASPLKKALLTGGVSLAAALVPGAVKGLLDDGVFGGMIGSLLSEEQRKSLMEYEAEEPQAQLVFMGTTQAKPGSVHHKGMPLPPLPVVNGNR
jgi:hypothetical protein